MANLALTLTLLFQVANTADLRCVGFIRESPVAADVFIAGTDEGVAALIAEGQIAYLNGPRLASLKPGGVYWAVRPEGRIPNRGSEVDYAIYYKSLGTVRIERLENDVALAVVLTSCQPMMKGDLIIPPPETTPVEFRGDLAGPLTPFPQQGMTSVIVIGKDDLHAMADGDFCFIGVGSRDGVRPGDRFTIYRLPTPLREQDLRLDGNGYMHSYEKIHVGRYDPVLLDMLHDRKLPPRPLGDLVVVGVGETTSAARIINSLAEITPGDLVIRR